MVGRPMARSSQRPSVLRRAMRRGRAHLRERRDPQLAAERDAFRALLERDHAGLLTDFGQGAKRTVLIVSLSDSTEQTAHNKKEKKKRGGGNRRGGRGGGGGGGLFSPVPGAPPGASTSSAR